MPSSGPAGAGARAELEAVNRAARLADGQQVVVPERGPGGTRVAGASGGEEGPISLGTATVEQLDTIEGIGPVTGRRHRRVPRRARRPRLGRPARPGERDRAGDDGVAAGTAAALSVRALAAPAAAASCSGSPSWSRSRSARSGEIRERAEDGLGRGCRRARRRWRAASCSARTRGSTRATSEDFRRSGLSHLLAVSGQNVALLALLAMPLLAALGIPLRERLLWVLGLIAVYVPLAGAGPSIQRAGVMGAPACSRRWPAGAPRASTRWSLAAARDPGDRSRHRRRRRLAAQLRRRRRHLPPRLAAARGDRRADRRRRPGARALAEGVAVTIAATLATAPLIAFHFETLSTTTLAANVLALPAVAPAMWLGMLSAAAAQVPGPAARAAQRGRRAAARLHRPGRRLVRRARTGPRSRSTSASPGLACRSLAPTRSLCACTAAGAGDGWRVVGTRRRPSLAGGRRSLWRHSPLALGRRSAWWRSDAADGPPAGCGSRSSTSARATRSCSSPPRAPAVLVDGGPPGDGILPRSSSRPGSERLGAAIVTHDQSDHAGGIEELLGTLPVAPARLRARRARSCCAAAARPGPMPDRVAAGREMRSGALRLEVLWPPPALSARTGRRRGPEPAGAGPARPLARLLDAADRRRRGGGGAARPGPGRRPQGRPPRQRRRRPGRPARPHPAAARGDLGRRDNSYGHPTPATLAILAEHRVRRCAPTRTGRS